MLKDNLHPRASRFLFVGLLLALAVMAPLIALVATGGAPAIIFGILAVLGMAVVCLGDLQRRDQLRRHEAEEEMAQLEPQRRQHVRS